MTQWEYAKAGKITPEMQKVAEEEGLNIDLILEGLKKGTLIIPRNINHRNIEPKGIGKGLRTKVNANIGTSTDFPYLEAELEKLKAAIASGADTVMDLSTGGAIDEIRKKIIENCPLPLGTVPIYQAAIEAAEKYGVMWEMKEKDLFQVIERHAKDGVDFITVHCGVTFEVIKTLETQGRLMDIVSRGGALSACWMIKNNKENPLYEHFDRILEIAKEYDVTLSLGDGLRPGCIADATDRPQIEELIVIGGLVDRARKSGVQAMVEGPGHIPMNQVEANVKIAKQICKEAPFYVLGPIVTDIAPGYDHITSAIGGALAAQAGADFLCYVTPSEHLGLPTAEEVKEGVVATRIAAHAADLVKGIKGAKDWDIELSKARKRLDWETQIKLSIDPKKARKYHQERRTRSLDGCSMCGEYCAMKLFTSRREED